jgi:hypothetical protein
MPRLGRSLALPWASPAIVIRLWAYAPTPLCRHAETLFFLPRVEWYARRHAGFEHLAGH